MRRTVGALAATLAMMLTVCGSGGGTAEGGQTGGQTGGPDRADTLTIAISSDEGTLTPFTNETGYPGNNLVKLIFDPLATLQGEDVVPLLAENIETTDNQTYTIALREGVKWQDGQPFTADDVLFSVDFYRANMLGDSAIDVRPIKDVTADGNTVTMTLNGPDPEFPRRILTDMAILPDHLWKSVDDVSKAGTELAVGTGPYKLTQYNPDRGYTFEANADYAMGKPKVQTIKVVVIPEESAQFAALRTGEIDMSTRIVPPQQMEALGNQSGIGLIDGTEFASTIMLFNTERPPFDRVEVRQALAKAINVQDVVDTALLGQGVPGSAGFIHPESPVGGKVIKSAYDVDAANAELDALGAARGADGIRVLDGKPMSFELLVQSSSTDRLRSAELIREMLDAVGVAVKISSLDPDAVTAKVWPDYDVKNGRNYDMSMWGWSGPVMLSSGTIAQLLYSDPADGTLNVVGYKDDAVDATLDQLTSAPTLEERTGVASKLQDQIAEAMPWVTLYYRNGAYAFREDTYDGWTWQNFKGALNNFSFVDYNL